MQTKTKTTRQKVTQLLKEYCKENDITQKEALDGDYTLPDFMQLIGQRSPLDSSFTVPEFYYNEATNNGSDYYVFVTFNTPLFPKSIVMDWDAPCYRLNAKDKLTELVDMWDKCESLENSLKTKN